MSSTNKSAPATTTAQTTGAPAQTTAGAPPSPINLSSPAKTIPLILGMASLLALFVGFGMQYFLIGSGRSAQKTIDPLMENSASTIVGVAVIAILGLSIYYVLQTFEKPHFWLFMLVMVQLLFLHVALSASLYQVEIVSK